jgi:hypothetical protein
MWVLAREDHDAASAPLVTDLLAGPLGQHFECNHVLPSNLWESCARDLWRGLSMCLREAPAVTAIPDLDPWRYLPVECDALTAVGWLTRDSAFETGSVPEPFFRKISELCTMPWQPIVTAGFHLCELCQFDGPHFGDNLFVPYSGRIYVAPVGIVHYVAAHWYRPPQIFIDAVLACPPIKSMAYKEALLENGGRNLVRAAAPRSD